jgi:isopenicillin N synthase-like dioxygenase
MVELHAIDMSAPEDEIISQIKTGITEIGFFALKNVPGYDEEAHFEAVKAFYEIPRNELDKLRWNHHCPGNENFYRGLTPFQPNDPAHKEMYDMGGSYHLVSKDEQKYPLLEPTPFPPHQEYEWIRLKFEEEYNRMHALSLKLLEYMAICLNRDRYFFYPWFEKDSMSTFRAIHILPRSVGIVDSSKLDENGRKLTTPEHCDSGFITILSTFGYPGLQVEIDGEFKSIQPKANNLIVNLGDIFSRITDFTLKATKHRVLDIGIERFSSPFFLEPKYSALIPRSLMFGQNKQVQEEQEDGEGDE